ncbi:OPT family small oligopeptide transporter [Cokeromyces recurvatus]|uniref:OPT family small oligopeptide transporter n=1 Tax=Cokeromyces recurvatus TaxID=90255 RepID=UPI00221EF85F|nr:OPT family small oligopeptide transporter [Cokeromyces recurvatus]KAI7904553.1 OPT family small oligopeptide transporter [Cokeromyces recurvatus]
MSDNRVKRQLSIEHVETEEKTNETNIIKEIEDEVELIKEDLPIDKFDKQSVEDEEDIDIQVVNELATMKDDTSLPCFTLRVFVTGIALACLSSSVHQLMVFKPVGIPLTNTFMLMIAYVFCTAWAKYLPLSSNWLNPGPFNIKEHTCIYVIVSAANTSAYATYILSAQNLYYHHTPGAAGSILLLLATQMVGYGIAGQLRYFLVYPSNMIWPTSLPTVSLLRTLNTTNSFRQTRIFFIVFAATFVYEFIPQYIMPFLGGISILCIIKTNSVWIQRLFGGLSVNEGLGILQLSFDWNYLSSPSPLVLPLWVQLNIYTGILLLWILAPTLYYFNIWNAQSFPFLSNSIFQLLPNGTSVVYPQQYVLGDTNDALNQTALLEIGKPHFSTIVAVQYIFVNFAITASIMHIALFYGKDIWQGFRSSLQSFFKHSKDQHYKEDPHMQMMAFYPEVPASWYYLIYVGGIGLNIVVSYMNSSQLPWWGVILAITMSTVLSLPLNMITAITGSGFGLNVFAEMICGFILPGLPVANMYFKTLGFNTLSQAGTMASDLKIGHYLKVPPRLIFMNQMLGTCIGCIFNYIVNHSIVNSQRDVLLNPTGNNIWNGATPQTINSAAITWGAIGPMNMFGPDSNYYIILWAFLIGFFLPVPCWILHRYYPKIKFFKYVNIPMILVGLTIVPGTATSWITISFIIVLVSQYYIKRRHRQWFIKYNYLISTALDSGTSLMVFIIAMSLYGGVSGKSYPFPSWWGNRTDLKYIDYCCAACT